MRTQTNSQLNLFQVAEIQVSYTPSIAPLQLPQIVSSKTLYDIMFSFWDKETLNYQELFYVAYLNRANRILGIHLHSQGGIAGTVVDVRQILGVALKANASSFILCHNHPSGNLRPSQADIDITQKIKQGAKAMEISLLDHLIITSRDFYSFADEGML